MKLSTKIKDVLSSNNFDFIHLKTVESTMTSIKKYFNNKNICLIADKQTSGVGRRGNEWISLKGNIYISFMIKYDLSIENHFLFSALTANSIVNFLRANFKENINIKKIEIKIIPNDLI